MLDLILAFVLLTLGYDPEECHAPFVLEEHEDSTATITDALGTKFHFRITEGGRCVERMD